MWFGSARQNRLERVIHPNSAALLGRHALHLSNSVYNKPPAYPNRHDSCAAKLVWEHLLSAGHQVDHLEPIIRAVYAGDSLKHRALYAEEYRVSRERGLHAVLKQAGLSQLSDADTYRTALRWLDAEDRRRLAAAGDRG